MFLKKSFPEKIFFPKSLDNPQFPSKTTRQKMGVSSTSTTQKLKLIRKLSNFLAFMPVHASHYQYHSGK
jgi:hypothetical protein